ncbi:MAG: energy-coupling factor transporter transmembrane protein EcfT [Deltaproteobacteria bacterium]|nr:energy-coupling factor transporter transmembrane protein EcfT [Deltaproteobacteria bacterium]
MTLDPRTKLFLALSFGLLVVCSHRAAWLVGEWAALLLLVLALRRGREYAGWLTLLLPMALFFGGLTSLSLGAAPGVTAGLGLLTVTTVFFAFFAVTAPEDLGDALVKARVPFPVAFVLSAALQFVPVIQQKAHNIVDAQRARGIPLELGWRALRRYPAFLLPLLVQSFQLAEELAEAMEARGFGRPGRTFLEEYRFGWGDWAGFGLGALFGATALFLASH